MTKFTVFTPTFNRAHLLHRVYDSLEAQTMRDFEWLVIDDGSSDGTSHVLREFASRADFPVRVFSQKNAGKVACINRALKHAKGEFFVVFDSDDWCVPNALDRIAEVWNDIPSNEREGWAGVSTLKCLPNGTIVGEDYARLGQSATYVDRFNAQIEGDKWEIIRTDVHRMFPYDLKGRERYMAPEYSWLGIGDLYKTRFLNEALSIVEYQADGITAFNLNHRVGSPRSAGAFYDRAGAFADTAWMRLRCAINLIRFAFHGRYTDQVDWRDAYKCFALIPAFVIFRLDRLRLRSR